MIPRPRPERFRLRRTMMFMNAQKPGLIKDAYIYGCDSIMLDLEDAVAENQKDAARFSLYHALKTIDYGDTEVIVRINGLDTPHWQEDVRVCVAGGADGIRIAKMRERPGRADRGARTWRPPRRSSAWRRAAPCSMAALESPKGMLNAYEICAASDADVRRRHLRRRLPQVYADRAPARRRGYAGRPGTDAAGRPGRRDPVL